MSLRTPVIPVLLTILVVPFVHAELESADISSGLLWIGNATVEEASEGDEPTGAPNPLLHTLSFSLPISLGSGFSFAPEIGIFTTQFGMVPGTSKAVHVEIETARAVWMIGVLVEPLFRLDVALSEQFSLGWNLGIVFLGYVPVWRAVWSEGWNDLGEIASYLYGNARYLYPDVGMGFSIRTHENFAFRMQARSYIPVYHLWDKNDGPFNNRLMVSLTVGLRILVDQNENSTPGSR